MENYTLRERRRLLTNLKKGPQLFEELRNSVSLFERAVANKKFHYIKNLIEVLISALILIWIVFLSQKPVLGFWQYTQFVIIFMIIARIVQNKNLFSSRIRMFYKQLDLTKKSIELMKFIYINNLNILISICEKGIIEESKESKEEKLKKQQELLREIDSYKLNISLYGGGKYLFSDSMYNDVKEYLDFIESLTYVESFMSITPKKCEILLEGVCDMTIKIDRGVMRVCENYTTLLGNMQKEINSFKHYFLGFVAIIRFSLKNKVV